MTKQEVLNLFETLVGINVVGVKFNYAVIKNINLLRSEYEAITGVKNKIIEKFAKKDKEGKFELKNVDATGKGFYIFEDKEGYEKENKKFAELLKEEVKVKLFKVKLSEVPEGLTTQQMSGIYNLIEE